MGLTIISDWVLYPSSLPPPRRGGRSHALQPSVLMGLRDANGKLAPHVYLSTRVLATAFSTAAVYSGKALKRLLDDSLRKRLDGNAVSALSTTTTTRSPAVESAVGSQTACVARVTLVSVDVMSFLVAATLATSYLHLPWGADRVDAIIQHMCALHLGGLYG